MDGPFVLSDAVVMGTGQSGTTTSFTANGNNCPSAPTTDSVLLLPEAPFVTVVNGARYFVPMGKSLCVFTRGGVSWSGFSPYP